VLLPEAERAEELTATKAAGCPSGSGWRCGSARLSITSSRFPRSGWRSRSRPARRSTPDLDEVQPRGNRGRAGRGRPRASILVDGRGRRLCGLPRRATELKPLAPRRAGGQAAADAGARHRDRFRSAAERAAFTEDLAAAVTALVTDEKADWDSELENMRKGWRVHMHPAALPHQLPRPAVLVDHGDRDAPGPLNQGWAALTDPRPASPSSSSTHIEASSTRTSTPTCSETRRRRSPPGTSRHGKRGCMSISRDPPCTSCGQATSFRSSACSFGVCLSAARNPSNESSPSIIIGLRWKRPSRL
jgi:hypothetical protein